KLYKKATANRIPPVSAILFLFIFIIFSNILLFLIGFLQPSCMEPRFKIAAIEQKSYRAKISCVPKMYIKKKTNFVISIGDQSKTGSSDS
ncbi:MAG: hypothetical protein SRB2_00993, partial [Desulfobacteraceae bacterium Eth-SRB2]